MIDIRWNTWPWLTMIIPFVIVALIVLIRSRRPAVLYSSVELLSGLPQTWRQKAREFSPWIRVLAFCLILVALARPQHGLQAFRIRTEGVAIEMCLDRSGSMIAMDFHIDGERVNRLDAVKQVFRDFVTGEGELDGRPDDLIGLVAFGGFAEGRAPLTLDHGALLTVLDSVHIPEPVLDSAGNVINESYLNEERATAIGDAIALAVDRLKDSESKSKVIILLSDGESNAGIASPQEAATAAKAFGIKIYAIGVGRNGLAPFPVVDMFGRTRLQPRQVRLDEKTLRKVAEITDGQYFRADDTETLTRVYASIDELEKTETEGRLYTEYRELFFWFLWPAIGLLMLERFLSSTILRTLP